jgi:hypothetical protein
MDKKYKTLPVNKKKLERKYQVYVVKRHIRRSSASTVD